MSLWYPCVYCTQDLHCTKFEEPGYESWCVLGPCSHEKPSNADKIRRMSDEELAEWLDGELPSKPKEWWLDWLKEEATDG